MMLRDCYRASILLERRAAGLGSAEGLFLEQHLQTCAECSSESRALDAVREAASDAVELGELGRRRVLLRALSAGPAEAVHAEERFRLGRTRAFAATALGLVLLVVVLALGLRAPEGGSRLAHGALALQGRVAAGAGLAVPRFASGETFTAERRAVRYADHARVELEAGASARWKPEQRLLLLERGGARIEVDPEPKRPFSVRTPRFRVDVLGTIFDVSSDSVRVTRGRVRIGIDEATVVLGAGESWRAPTLEPALASRRDSKVSASIHLAHARSLLAVGKIGAARAALGQALATAGAAGERAEAHSLLAECALVAGDAAEAKRRYGQVAKQHPGTPAAETALFAAARLEKDATRARALLDDYLRLYPGGRFRAEARARLRALPK